jgi:hypothetical protein
MLTALLTFFAPAEEPVVQLTSADIAAIIAESERLVVACAEKRMALALAFGEPSQPCPAPIAERPSPEFSAAMERAERRTGARLVKLFA